MEQVQAWLNWARKALLNALRIGRNFYYDGKTRARVFQGAVVAALLFLTIWIYLTYSAGVGEEAQEFSYAFLAETAPALQPSFGSWLLGYGEGASFWRLIGVGVVNTLFVTALCVALATAVGAALGLMRLANNIVLSSFAAAAIAALRNVPILVQGLIWYFVVYPAMAPRGGDAAASTAMLGVIVVDDAGLRLPYPQAEPAFLAVVLAALVAAMAWRFGGRRVNEAYAAVGRTAPTALVGLSLLVLAPLFIYYATGAPLSWEWPALGEDGYEDGVGMILSRGLFALAMAVSLYGAAVIADIVRTALVSIDRGQGEAAAALGLKTQHTARLVMLPQAMRVMTPPIVSQYLAIFQYSSLAFAIAAPGGGAEGVSDLFGLAVFVGEAAGRPLEMALLALAFYGAVSVGVYVLLRRFALAEPSHEGDGALAMRDTAALDPRFRSVATPSMARDGHAGGADASAGQMSAGDDVRRGGGLRRVGWLGRVLSKGR